MRENEKTILQNQPIMATPTPSCTFNPRSFSFGMCTYTLGGCQLVSCIPMTWFPPSRKQYQRRHVSICTTNDEWYACHTRDFCIHQLQVIHLLYEAPKSIRIADRRDRRKIYAGVVCRKSITRHQLNSRLLFLNRKDDEATQVNTMMEEGDCLQMDW